MTTQTNKLDYLNDPYFIIIDFFCQKLFEDVYYDDFNNFLKNEKIKPIYFEGIFLKSGLSELKNDKISLNFQDRFVSSLKKTRDSYLIHLLPTPIKNEICLVYENIISKLKNKLLAVLLIGSAARNKMTRRSDIDLLIITKQKYRERFKDYIFTIEPQFYTAKEFDELFKKSDELILWSLKYGLIMYDNEYIFKYLTSETLSIGQTSILNKRTLIQRLIYSISSSREIPVTQLAAKIQRLIFQIARLIIILHNDIPLSRWELADQIRPYSPSISLKINQFYELNMQDREQLIKFFYQIKSQFYKEVRDFIDVNSAM